MFVKPGSRVGISEQMQVPDFPESRRSKPGVLIRLVPDGPRVWDLAAILPA